MAKSQDKLECLDLIRRRLKRNLKLKKPRMPELRKLELSLSFLLEFILNLLISIRLSTQSKT